MFKKLLLAILTCLAVCLGVCGCTVTSANQRSAPRTASAGQEAPARPRHERFTVTGKGCVTVAPDYAVLSVGIDALADTLSEAVEKSYTLENSLRAAVASYGSLSEECCCAYPLYDARGYQVSKTYALRTSGLDAIPEITAAMTAAGATRLCGVSYDVSDRASVEREALRLAIENAKTTAAFLAADYKLVKIEECGCYPCRMDLRDSVSGTVTFEACVQATFCRPVSEETPAA